MLITDLFERYNLKPEGVLHLGANTGQEAETYYKLGARQVIWVEALPKVHAALALHIAKYPGQVALQACVGDVDGMEVNFHEASNQGQSSSFLELGTHAQAHPTVKYVRDHPMKTVRVDTLLRTNGLELNSKLLWFLNIDLQGVELLALKGMGDLLQRFDYAYIEVNEKELYKGCARVGQIDEYLRSFGFVGVQTKMTGWGWGDKFYERYVGKTN